MNAFDNTNIKDKLCGGCNCAGFVPGVSYTIDPAAKTIVFADTSAYPAGDGPDAIIVHAYDKRGKRVAGKLTNGAGATANVSTLDLSSITITATVVSDKGCKADLSAYDLGVTALAGGLGNTTLAGDANENL
jgi:hypothetical protein